MTKIDPSSEFPGSAEPNKGQSLSEIIHAKPDPATELLKLKHEIHAEHYYTLVSYMVENHVSPKCLSKRLNSEPELFDLLRIPRSLEHSERTLKRKLAAWVKNARLSALADGRRHNPGAPSSIPEEAALLILAELSVDPFKSYASLTKSLEEAAAEFGYKSPSYDAVRRYCIQLETRDLPRVVRGAIRAGFYKDDGIKIPRTKHPSNYEWQIDTNRMDVQVLQPDGKDHGHPYVTWITDSRSGLIMGWIVTTREPNEDHILQLIFDAISFKGPDGMQWGGVPISIKSDGALVSTLARNYRRTLNDLGIKIRKIDDKQSTQNGSVESSFKTVKVLFSGDFPSYLKSKRKLNVKSFTGNWDGFCRTLEEYILNLCTALEHTKKKATRYEIWFQGLPQGHPIVKSEKELDEIIYTLDCRIVDGGCVQVENVRWTSANMGGLNGKTVEVGIPIRKPIKYVRAWASGRFLGKLGPDTDPAVASAVADANITDAAVVKQLVEHIKGIKPIAHQVFNRNHHKVVNNSKLPAGNISKRDKWSPGFLEVEI